MKEGDDATFPKEAVRAICERHQLDKLTVTEEETDHLPVIVECLAMDGQAICSEYAEADMLPGSTTLPKRSPSAGVSSETQTTPATTLPTTATVPLVVSNLAPLSVHPPDNETMAPCVAQPELAPPGLKTKKRKHANWTPYQNKSLPDEPVAAAVQGSFSQIQDLTATAGQNLTFNTSRHGLDPESHIVWSKDGYHVLFNFNEGKVVRCASPRFSLDSDSGSFTIHNVSLTDAGMYQGQIFNGQVSVHKFNLTVQEADPPEPQTITPPRHHWILLISCGLFLLGIVGLVVVGCRKKKP
ncbi:uncharacterized protein V6R79_016235 [Siganus canaliculatus]